MLLLAGSTGRLGSRIARELLSARTAVRVLCRPTSGFAPLRRMGAEIVFGDLREPETLRAACVGIDTVMTTASALRHEGEHALESVDVQGTGALMQAAVSGGARRVLFVSARGADSASPQPVLAAKGRAEAWVRDCGLAWTVLAPSLTMEAGPGEVVGRPLMANQPVLIAGNGETRHSFIAEHDVAAFCVAAITNEAAVNRRLELGGPQAVSWRDVMAVYEAALGRAGVVQYESVGARNDALTPGMQHLLAAMDVTGAPVDSAALAQELGVRQTPLEAWVRASLAMTRRGA